jgi:hypothetical protein
MQLIKPPYISYAFLFFIMMIAFFLQSSEDAKNKSIPQKISRRLSTKKNEFLWLKEEKALVIAKEIKTEIIEGDIDLGITYNEWHKRCAFGLMVGAPVSSVATSLYWIEPKRIMSGVLSCYSGLKSVVQSPAIIGGFYQKLTPYLVQKTVLDFAKNNSKELLISAGMAAATVAVGYGYWRSREKYENDHDVLINKLNGNKKRSLTLDDVRPKFPRLGVFTALPLAATLAATRAVNNVPLGSLFLMTAGCAIAGVAYDHYVRDQSIKQCLTQYRIELLGEPHRLINDYIALLIRGDRYPMTELDAREKNYKINFRETLSAAKRVQLFEQDVTNSEGINQKLSNLAQYCLNDMVCAKKKPNLDFGDCEQVEKPVKMSMAKLFEKWKKLPDSIEIDDAKQMKTNLSEDAVVDEALNFVSSGILGMRDALYKDVLQHEWENADDQKLLEVFKQDKPIVGDPFHPHVIEKIAKKDDIYIFWGDVHGGKDTTIRCLENLAKKGLVTIGEEIKIKPGVHIVFHGDFVDRGHYGAEVLYILSRLKEKNPDQVIFIRGNHEDFDIQVQHQFLNELDQKFSPLESMRIRDNFSRASELMPAAIFLGVVDQNSGADGTYHIDYINCMHGAIDPGFNPVDNNVYRELKASDRKKHLLQKNSKTRAIAIKELKQATFLKEHKKWLSGGSDKKIKQEESSAAFNNIENIINGGDVVHEGKVSTDTNRAIRKNMAYLWGDYWLNKDALGIRSNYSGRIEWSARAAHLTFNLHSDAHHTLRTVIRGHQHIASKTEGIMPSFFNADKNSSLYGVSVLWENDDDIQDKAYRYTNLNKNINKVKKIGKYYDDACVLIGAHGHATSDKVLNQSDVMRKIITLPPASCTSLGYDQATKERIYDELGNSYVILKVGDSFDTSTFRAIRFDRYGNDKDIQESSEEKKEKENESDEDVDNETEQ